AESDAPDRRLFEDFHTAFVRRGCEPHAGAVGIEDGALLVAKTCAGLGGELRADGAGVENRRVESGVEARFLFALEASGLIGVERDGDGRLRLEITVHVETAEQRRKIERRPAPRLERVARRTEAHRLFGFEKTDAGTIRNPAERKRRAAPADLVRL